MPIEYTYMSIYEVGGAVRDKLLGKNPKDIDYIVTEWSEEEMNEKFERNDVGENEHPVWLDVNGIIAEKKPGEPAAEVTIPRIEISTGDDHDSFRYKTEGVSIEEDLKRRDLTINSMARNVETGELLDPFGGREDLENNVARHVSASFSEDPIRVLRLARFVARYDLNIAPETIEIARETAPNLTKEPVERIWEELIKMFKDTGDNQSPRRYFDVLRDVNALQYSYPLIYWAIVIPTDSEHHQEGDLYDHTMLVLEQANNIRPDNPKVLLAALVHDLGKIKQHNMNKRHDNCEGFVNFWFDYNQSNDYKTVISDAVTQHMRIHTFTNEPRGEMSSKKKITFVDRYMDVDKGMNLDELLDLAEADTFGRIPQGEFDRVSFEEKMDRAKNAIESVPGRLVLNKKGWIDENGNITVDGDQVNSVIKNERAKYYDGNVAVIDDMIIKVDDTISVETSKVSFEGLVTDIQNKLGRIEVSVDDKPEKKHDAIFRFTDDYVVLPNGRSFEEQDISVEIKKFTKDGIEFRNKKNLQSYIEHNR